MITDKIHIKTDLDECVEATAPVILSVSRSTDIPAFYAKWFFNRLAKGYCVWYNPFNRKPMYVAFARVRVIVFWTKNPAPIIPYLHELDERGIHYYFQFTLNDYILERFEPNVPSVEKRVEIFRKLSEMIGHDRVIWRFDPLIVTSQITPRNLLSRIWKIGNMLRKYTDKLVFSFVDVKAYRKVQLNLVKETCYFTKENVDLAEMTETQRKEIIEGLVRMRDIWHNEGWNITLATCSEDIDLEVYGIEHNRCIDGDLMERLWTEDEKLVYYLHTGKFPKPDLFGDLPSIPPIKKDLKDKGQRNFCGCVVSKDIGMYDTCHHLCVYCYANANSNVVVENQKKHHDNSESIIQ